MKQSYEIILDEMATTLRDLQEQANSMKETLLSVKISLEVLESSRPKRQENQEESTSVDGLKNPKLKQPTTPRHVDLTKEQYYPQSQSKPAANQSRTRIWYLG